MIDGRMMRIFRRDLKKTLARLLYASGFLDHLARRRLKNRVVVLMYHRVVPDSRLRYCHSTPGIIVREGTFRRHLAFLRRRFQVLSLDEFVVGLSRSQSFPDNSCLITFDDGWSDNYHTAYPILREFGLPATIFLPYDYIDGERMFWQEELALRFGQLRESGQERDRRFLQTLTKGAGMESDEGLGAFIQSLKQGGYGKINGLLQQVRDRQIGETLPEHDNRYLTWSQIAEMRANGIAFGSHCMSHRILTQLEPAEKLTEIFDSKSLIESKLGDDVKAIAYPNGDWDDEAAALAGQAGYRVGFSTNLEYVSSRSRALVLPRINVHEQATDSEAMLLATILRVF